MSDALSPIESCPIYRHLLAIGQSQRRLEMTDTDGNQVPPATTIDNESSDQ